jgi:hypothetical protein
VLSPALRSLRAADLRWGTPATGAGPKPRLRGGGRREPPRSRLARRTHRRLLDADPVGRHRGSVRPEHQVRRPDGPVRRTSRTTGDGGASTSVPTRRSPEGVRLSGLSTPAPRPAEAGGASSTNNRRRTGPSAFHSDVSPPASTPVLAVFRRSRSGRTSRSRRPATPPMGFGAFRRNQRRESLRAGLPHRHLPLSGFLTPSAV